MEKSDLLKQFKEEFTQIKQELGFQTTLEELDEIFYLKDAILQTGFVSDALSRMICGRIRDTFNGWVGQLHGWIMPNPSSMIAMAQHELFTQEQRDEMITVMEEFAYFGAQNAYIAMSKNKQEEAKLIDQAPKLWSAHKEKLTLYNKIIADHYNNKIQQHNTPTL